MQDNSPDTLPPGTPDPEPATPEGAPDAPAEEKALEIQGVDINQIWMNVRSWGESMLDQLMSYAALWQLIAVIVAIALGWVLSRWPNKRLRAMAQRVEERGLLKRVLKSLARIAWAGITVGLLWIAMGVFTAYGLSHGGLRVVASLLNAFIVVRLIAANMRPGFWSLVLAVLAWVIAALYILRLLDPVTDWLSNAVIGVAGFRVSILQLITSTAIAVVALWLGRLAGDAAQNQLKASRSLTPSMAGLLGQVLKIIFMLVALMIALTSLGVNLTALTVFSGALGVGIGFGMQAIFSNLISGIIILFEKSVKVGDFIELQSGVTGLVQEINIRSTRITTNDNVDILVPNEEFIKAQVINWTLRDSKRRLRIPFGVAYGTDKEKVKRAALEAAESVEWTYDRDSNRAPQVWLVGFGDSSLDFELVVWLSETAVIRPARVEADYYWELHSALERYEIEIPFPQRDLNIRQPADLSVHVRRRTPTRDNGDGDEGET